MARSISNLIFATALICCTVAQYQQHPPTYPPAHQPTVPKQLRPPPIPSWVERMNNEKSDNDVEDGLRGSGHLVKDDDHEGSSSGIFDGSGTGEGGGEDEFTKMMSEMDKEAADTGVNCPNDVIFVLDATSSVRGIFEEYIQYISKVIEGLDISKAVDHVGVIVYSSIKKQREIIGLGQFDNTADLQKAVKALPFFSGITATGQALSFAADHNENRRKNIKLNYVVLTDGYSYDDISQGARKLHSVPNSIVHSVSIGNAFLKTELETIAGSEQRVLHGSTTYGTLVKHLKNCQAKTSFQKDGIETVTVRYIPTATDSQGRNLVPNPKFSRNTIRHFNDKATPNDIQRAKSNSRSDRFVAPTTEETFLTTDCKYDIGLIFDASGSLVQTFKQQLELANQLVDQLPISGDQTRVAIVQYAGKTKTNVLTSFSDLLTKSQVKKIITYSNFYSGTTFTNQALLKMATLFKDTGRSDAKKKLIIFTDGYSADDTVYGIERLKSLGILIYTVGINQEGSRLNLNELENMASSPENFYFSGNFKDLLLQFPTSKYCS